MNPKRRQRLLAVVAITLSVSVAVLLVLYALRQNISLFYTPSQIVNGEVIVAQNIRVGGLVEKGSVHYRQDGRQVEFVITDMKHQIKVYYHGLLPDLFREGQGIVAQGHLDQKRQFVADQVLAKHDENYRPPEVAMALDHDS